ncbi:MAG: class I SAM-dependent methyltransferase [Geobacteraceae bacterium]|nr:class I SAM-dependent methyltransferase [Geobacteraceae bacterium]
MPAVTASSRNGSPNSCEKTAPSDRDTALSTATLTSETGVSFVPALRYKPTLDPNSTRNNLYKLLTPGIIRDRCIKSHIERMHRRSQIYYSNYPYGQWTPGLVVTDEMRSATETYLPMEEIDSALRRLYSLAIRYRPLTSASVAGSIGNWLDFLTRHRSICTGANPALFLENLLHDETFRIHFLFEHFLPRRHGGGFNRYPCQSRFLKCHLESRSHLERDGIRCLDAACGTGEGTYDLAGSLKQWRIPVVRQGIHGSTIEPLELFAAAHGFFPHDPAREAGFRSVIQSLFDDKALDEVEFLLEDVSIPRSGDETTYDVILCNGLLGGPALHLEEDIIRTVDSLAGRLRPGGILLAADRFHSGWKKLLPASRLMELMSLCRLKVVFTEEGVAATKGI